MFLDMGDGGITDADKAVKVLDEEVVKSAAGSDWHNGEWEGLGNVEEGESIVAPTVTYSVGMH